jgi:hypothetical protein
MIFASLFNLPLQISLNQFSTFSKANMPLKPFSWHKTWFLREIGGVLVVEVGGDRFCIVCHQEISANLKIYFFSAHREVIFA